MTRPTRGAGLLRWLPNPSCLLSVALVVAASPPFDVPGLELVAWVPLLVHARAGRRALVDGLWWALCTGVACTWWLAPAVTGVLHLDVLTAGVAVGICGLLVALPAAPWPWLLQRGSGVAAVGALVGGAMLASCLVPWPVPHALALVAHDTPLRAVAALLGPAGMVGALAACNGGLARAWLDRARPRHAGGALLAGPGVVGALVLAAWSAVPEPVDTRVVALVQASRSHDEVERARAGDDAAADAIVEAYRDLSEPVVHEVDLLVWPEAVYPGVWRVPFTPAQRARQLAFDRWVDAGHAQVLVGTWDRDPDPVDDRLYNAVVALTPDPDPAPPEARIHRKHLLLPMAEDVPWTTFDASSRRRYPFSAFFLRGPPPAPLALDGVSVGVTICFEDLHPWVGRRHVEQGAELLVNVANDGWFEALGEPAWHLAAARLRAAEVGRALVRATNDGTSAVIDADGALLTQLGRGEVGAPVVDVPLHRHQTLFARLGHGPAIVLGLLLLGVGVTRRDRSSPER